MKSKYTKYNFKITNSCAMLYDISCFHNTIIGIATYRTATLYTAAVNLGH